VCVFADKLIEGNVYKIIAIHFNHNFMQILHLELLSLVQRKCQAKRLVLQVN